MINYNLIAGKIDMADINLILNPENIEASYIPENIQHYPIINGKINLLVGEEIKRRFDYRVVVTNPDQVSDIETERRDKYVSDLQAIIEQTSMTPEESAQEPLKAQQNEQIFNKELEKLDRYVKYE
jgi:hypothetical protein